MNSLCTEAGSHGPRGVASHTECEPRTQRDLGPSVLVSGAGVAGTTAACFLARRGYRVTVVEGAAGQRSSGNPVDVRGPATAVARDMGVLAALRERATHATGMRVVDAAGRTVARLPMQANKDAIEVRHAGRSAALVVPKTRFGLAARNATARLLTRR